MVLTDGESRPFGAELGRSVSRQAADRDGARPLRERRRAHLLDGRGRGLRARQEQRGDDRSEWPTSWAAARSPRTTSLRPAMPSRRSSARARRATGRSPVPAWRSCRGSRWRPSCRSASSCGDGTALNRRSRPTGRPWRRRRRLPGRSRRSSCRAKPPPAAVGAADFDAVGRPVVAGFGLDDRPTACVGERRLHQPSSSRRRTAAPVCRPMSPTPRRLRRAPPGRDACNDQDHPSMHRSLLS